MAQKAISKKSVSILCMLVLCLFAMVAPLFFNGSSSAISGSQFKAGRIIDDVVFYNKNAMSAAEIQAFLESKVPVCNTNRSPSGSANDSGPPYICLKDYRQTTSNIAPESGLCNGYAGAANESAAQIIYKTAQSCGINPQVLLVLLQKEQGLITDTWPWQIQYQKATGAFCPDTAPCDPAYAGFFYQVYYGAHRFKVYAANPNGYNYRAGRDNYILYNPSASCGGSTVYIQNQATASLYIYTPYQPNPATLAVGLGVEAPCGAYGNKNFWWWFTSWFGTTYAPDYSWQISSQEIYATQNRTTPINWGVLSPNSTYYVRVKARNTGNQTWERSGAHPITLATTADRNSPLCDNSWISCNRAATIKEASVAPGEVGTFEFSVKTPNSLGTTTQYFNLVSEGHSWMNDIGMHLQFTARPSTHEWSYLSQGLYSDSSHINSVNSSVLLPNATYYARITMRNTGNTTWKNTGANPIRLGTANQIDRNSTFCDNSWISCNRAATIKEASVAPGEVGTFEFSVKTPNSLGTFNEYFRPVVEGQSWLRDIGQHWSLGIKPATYQWSYVDQKVYTSASKTTTANINSTPGGTSIYAQLRIKNTGNTTWKNTGANPIRLGTANQIDRNSTFCDNSWISCNRAATIKEASVAPGEVGTFEFWMKAPYATNGTKLLEYFRPVADGAQWLNDLGQNFAFTMNSSKEANGYVSQAAYTNSSRTQSANLANSSRNTTYYLQIKLRNTSGVTWVKTGAKQIRLGTANQIDRNSTFCDNSWISCNRAATIKEASVAPGEVGTFEFSVKTPNSLGTFNEYFRPVVDGEYWLQDLGLHYQINVTN